MVMTDDNKIPFPTLSVSNWWAVRDRLHQSPNVKLTPGFLSSLLGMQPRSAQINVFNYLRQMEIIDDSGNVTELGHRWRSDADYPAVCKAIRLNIYPEELLHLFSEATVNREGVEKWIMTHMRVGQSAASKQSRFFVLLTEGNPSKRTDETRQPRNGATQKPGTKPIRVMKSPEPTQHQVSPVPEEQVSDQAASASHKRKSSDPAHAFPSLHIDIQIHIAPETPAEQIDKIFASMAKHLQGIKGNVSE